jgi:hypothetical protein
MPTKLNILAKSVTHCAPCEFHKSVNAFYGSDHSWRDYNCMHPHAYDNLQEAPLADPEKEKLRQRLIGHLLEEGRNIGRTELQPGWCPLKRE